VDIRASVDVIVKGRGRGVLVVLVGIGSAVIAVGSQVFYYAVECDVLGLIEVRSVLENSYLYRYYLGDERGCRLCGRS
jgi:hypothetical protein